MNKGCSVFRFTRISSQLQANIVLHVSSETFMFFEHINRKMFYIFEKHVVLFPNVNSLNNNALIKIRFLSTSEPSSIGLFRFSRRIGKVYFRKLLKHTEHELVERMKTPR